MPLHGAFYLPSSLTAGLKTDDSTTTTAALTQAFFVAPDGTDTAAGTLAAPFRTLYHAQNVVRQLPPSIGAEPRATVTLRAGVFSGPENAPLEFTPADSGTVWQSYQNEVVLISGGVAVPESAFTPHPTLPGMLQANLTQLGINHSTLGIVGGNESTGTALDRSGRFELQYYNCHLISEFSIEMQR